MKHLKICCLFFLIFMLHPKFLMAARQVAVVSANKYATEVGIKILKNGGNAADAAIAVAFVLAVVEPQSSGIGGGGVLLYYNKAQNKYSYLDYMPQAPLKATDYHIKATKRKIKTSDEKTVFKIGPTSIAVPGFVMGLDMFYKRFGKLEWNLLLSDAIDYADNGIPISKELSRVIKKQSDLFIDQNNFTEFFQTPLLNKKPVLTQGNLARTLSKISQGGAKEFYYGALAKIVLKELKDQKTLIDKEDWESYRVYFRNPKKFLFKDNLIVSAGPPSLGGAILEHLLRASHANKIKFKSPYYASFIEKQLKEFYLKNHSTLDNKATTLGHTTHISVMDSDGNIASMTNSLNDPFGSGVILSASGILMNNALYDFYADKKHSAKLIKNQERAFHYLTPTIVFKGFDPVLVIGTSGGKTIPVNLFHIMQQNLIENKSLKASIKSPKFYSFPNQKISVYEKGYPKKLIPKKTDFKLSQSVTQAGNIQIISKIKNSTKTYSDPRGEGVGVVLTLKK